ncbi:MAG: isoleucine--tRNA ligase [Candidatus Micrarchaeota archaeon]|nr:isoleucine--tRNA ligase [Candidatus Micrarchaeota archaeon]
MFDLQKNEEYVLEYWKANGILRKARERNRGNRPFYFLDGPPYVTGELAAHHIWVETIKDLVLRYRRLRGFDVHDRAGFDVHGLPIEVKVEKRLGIKSKADIEQRIGIEAFVKACKDFAKEQSIGAIRDYTRFASSLDFENPYMPYESYYISKGWQLFKEMHSKGLVYKGIESLSYCPHDETVLSTQGPEVEHADETDPSLFVRFKVVGSGNGLEKNTYLVIWTTTPWTLPSNMAIAVNPNETYVVAKAGDVDYVVAKARLGAFLSSTKIDAKAGREMKGSGLVGVRYESPLEEEVPKQKELAKYHKVIASESFVTVSEGTGLLHVAPGHGPEDFKLGKEYHMPLLSPVDEHATYNDDAGIFKGLKLPEDANKAVLKVLKENGSLLYLGNITHSYPHCWRCHSKLIFRATDQWFINIGKIKKKMLKENSKITWYPAVAREWFGEAVENSPDWTVSRQRYWGTPIPIWVCGKCNAVEVIGSIEELMQKAGMKEQPKDLHRPLVDNITFRCSGCDGEMRRIPDIFDVWYDAGISHTASLSGEQFKRLFPADWITESRDQIRGWFTALLRTSVAVYGKRSFDKVSIGGMIKDELGQEMHRHLGNTVSATELLQITSADGFRLWCSSHPRWLELKLKKEELSEADSNIITIYNIAALVKEFAALSGTDIKRIRRPRAGALGLEERAILSRFNTLIDNTTKNLDGYLIDKAVNELLAYALEDLSRFYLKTAKKKVNGGRKAEMKAITNLLNYIVQGLLVMMAPVIPFTCEKLHMEMYGEGESVFLERWPKARMKDVDTALEGQFEVAKEAITAILSSREKLSLRLRLPIEKATVEVNSDSAYDSLQKLAEVVEAYTNIKKLEVRRNEASHVEIRPLFARIGPDFKQDAGAVAEAMKSADAGSLLERISKDGSCELRSNDGRTFNVRREHFETVEKILRDDAIPFKYGIAYADKNISEELKEEGMIREFERRIQIARKELGLKKSDRIELYYEASDELSKAISKNEKIVKKDVGALKLGKGSGEGEAKEFEIDEQKVRITVRIIRRSPS